MLKKIEIFSIAQNLAQHAASRQAVIARNVANSDTPGYQARDLPEFNQIYRQNAASQLAVTRPGHIAGVPASTAGAGIEVQRTETAPNGNGVSIETEMVKAAETRRQHDMALAIYGKSLGILRASLGRR